MKTVKEKIEEFYKPGGKIICICGKSGIGKSTRALELRVKYPQAVILDGDSVRHYVNKNLGYTEEDRRKNNEIIAGIAEMFYNQGHIVVISTVRADIAYEYLGPEIEDKILVNLETEQK